MQYLCESLAGAMHGNQQPLLKANMSKKLLVSVSRFTLTTPPSPSLTSFSDLATIGIAHLHKLIMHDMLWQSQVLANTCWNRRKLMIFIPPKAITPTSNKLMAYNASQIIRLYRYWLTLCKFPCRSYKRMSDRCVTLGTWTLQQYYYWVCVTRTPFRCGQRPGKEDDSKRALS